MKKFLYGMIFHFFLFVVLREKQLTNVQRQTMPSHNTILNISLNYWRPIKNISYICSSNQETI